MSARRKLSLLGGALALALALAWLWPTQPAPAPPANRSQVRAETPLPPRSAPPPAAAAPALDTATPPLPSPEAGGRYLIRCAIALDDLGAAEATFTEDLGESWVSATVPVLSGEVELPAREPEGHGWLRVRDHERIELSWSKGRCDAPRLSPAPLSAAITGTVRHAAGTPAGEVWIQGCGQARLVPDVDGSFYFLTEPGPCTLRATRKEGALYASGEPVQVVAVEGEDVEVRLDLPSWRPAGIGIAVEEVDGGVGVRRVIEDTPAWEAGLRDGDVVLEIDGEPTAEMDLQHFVEHAVGEEGTSVELRVRGEDGTEERLVLERARVEIHP